MKALLIALTMLVASTGALAESQTTSQTAPVAPVIPITAPKLDSESTLRLLNGGPGQYNFYTLDKSALQKMFFEQVFKKQDTDYKYFLDSVKGIELAFGDLLREVYRKGEPASKDYIEGDGLFEMSKKSILAKETGFIPATDFMDAINRFNQSKIALDARIETLTAIAEGIVPSAEEVEADESGIKKVPNYGKVNFEPVKKFYAERVALIEKFASDLPHNIMLPGGVPFFIKKGSGKGLVLEADDALVRITPEKLKELRSKVLELRLWDEEAETALSEYTRFLMDRIFAFTKTYGSSERFRRLGEVEQKKRDEEVRVILGNFWSRSYLRSVYGMPVCAIGASYDKNWFHLDVFKFSTTALMNLHEHPVCDANAMVRIEQNYRNLLRRADNRSEKIMDGNLGFIGTVENLLTFLGGKRNEAVASQAMLRLLAADLYEERLLLDGGSIAAMADRYRARYYGNEEDEVFFRRMQMAYDPDVTADTIKEIYKSQDREAMVAKILGSEKEQAFQERAGFGTGENLRTKYANVLIHMDTKLEELKQAETIEAQIANALNPNNSFRVKVQARKKNL